MYEGKKNTDKWFPVILLDDTDFKTAETGKVFGDVTCKYSYEAATSLSTYSVTTDDWKEGGEGKRVSHFEALSGPVRGRQSPAGPGDAGRSMAPPSGLPTTDG